MTLEESTDSYMLWRKRTPCYLISQFDKWFEGQAWDIFHDGYGKESVCGNYRMVVTEKSIRLIKSNSK